MDRMPVFTRAALVNSAAAIVGLIGACLAFASFAWGEDCKLFPVLGDRAAVSLFAPAQEPTCDLFPVEHEAARESSNETVRLFDCDQKSEEIEGDDFQRNQEMVLFAWEPLASVLDVDRRRYLVSYGPDYCLPCDSMFAKVKDGDRRLRVRCVKASESTFPDFIREYAKAHGYPVHHWTSPRGKHAMSHGIKTLDELVELAETEPGETPKAPKTKKPSGETAVVHDF